MAKVIAGNDGARQLDVGGVRLDRIKGGFDVPDRDAKAIAQAIGGCVAGVGLGGSRVRSFWCEPCQRPECPPRTTHPRTIRLPRRPRRWRRLTSRRQSLHFGFIRRVVLLTDVHVPSR